MESLKIWSGVCSNCSEACSRENRHLGTVTNAVEIRTSLLLERRCNIIFSPVRQRLILNRG